MNWPTDFLNQILYGDALELIKLIPDESVDLVFTDPPYGLGKEEIPGDESLEIFRKIAKESYRVLKKDAFFITFSSTKLLPEMFKDNPFSYFWQFILYYPHSRVHSPIGLAKYTACLVFKKGNPKVLSTYFDVITSKPDPEERAVNHPALKQKHFIRALLAMFSKEGDLILDPFIGSGSTAIACLQLGRKFIGFEIDKNYYEMAQKRLAKFLKNSSQALLPRESDFPLLGQ